jgi:hypothetical protein
MIAGCQVCAPGNEEVKRWADVPSSQKVTPDAGDEPARESHFYDDYESAILHKGGAADFAVVVGFLHMKLRQ